MDMGFYYNYLLKVTVLSDKMLFLIIFFVSWMIFLAIAYYTKPSYHELSIKKSYKPRWEKQLENNINYERGKKNKKMHKAFILLILARLGIFIAVFWPSSEEDDSDILLAVLMTKSYSVPVNIPWKNFQVCDIRDRNQCLKNARFRNPKHVLMVDLDNYNIEKKKPIRGLLQENTMYSVPIINGLHTWNVPVLLPQVALETCKYNGKLLECPPETLHEYTDAYTIQDYSKPENDMDIYDKNKHFIHIGKTYESLNKTDIATTWYKKQININETKCSSERYYALYRTAVINLLHKNKGNHDEFWLAYICNPFRKETLYYLARLARSREQFSACLLYTHAALILGDPAIDQWYVEYTIYNWAIEDQHAECLYYTGRKEHAKWYWNRILEKSNLLDENTRKRIEANTRLL